MGIVIDHASHRSITILYFKSVSLLRNVRLYFLLIVFFFVVVEK